VFFAGILTMLLPALGEREQRSKSIMARRRSGGKSCPSGSRWRRGCRIPCKKEKPCVIRKASI
jgi:hypothetical protein